MPALSDAVGPTDTEVEMEGSEVTGVSVSPEPNVGNTLLVGDGQERDNGEEEEGKENNKDGDGEARFKKKRRKLVEVDYTGYTPVLEVSSDGVEGAGYVCVDKESKAELHVDGREERRAMLRREAEMMRKALEEKERELDALD